MGGSAAASAGRVALKEGAEEVVERAARETLEEAGEKVAKEGGEALAKKTGKELIESLGDDAGDIAKVTDGADEVIKVANKAEFETITLEDGTKVKRLKPKSEYSANGYKYKTDSNGRITEVEGDLKLEKGGRNPYAQRTVGKNDGRLPDDQGGHLIGDQFGGAGGKENLVPMDKSVNNYHKGEWGQMEKNWAEQLKDGKSVKVKIEPQYSGNDIRPSSFKITENIDGVIEKFTIFN